MYCVSLHLCVPTLCRVETGWYADKRVAAAGFKGPLVLVYSFVQSPVLHVSSSVYYTTEYHDGGRLFELPPYYLIPSSGGDRQQESSHSTKRRITS